MAEIYIKIEKDDISTTSMGNDFLLECDKCNIIFSPQAIEKLIDDYAEVLKGNIKKLKEPQRLIAEK